MKIGLLLLPVNPEYDRRARPCFDDIIACLRRTLGDRGHDVRVISDVWPGDCQPIILNYCVAAAPGVPPSALEPPTGAIIYNQEAFDSPWNVMWEKIAAAVRDRHVRLWEMRVENVARWREHHGVAAEHVPFGYVQELVNVEHAPEKSVDVLFYGSLSARRKAVLATMSSWGLRVRYHAHSSGSERERLMGQSKIVLSLRCEAGYQVETIRLIHALANECFVVCEEGPGIESFEGGVVATDYDSLTYVCADWAGRSDRERNGIASRGRDIVHSTEARVHDALAAAGF